MKKAVFVLLSLSIASAAHGQPSVVGVGQVHTVTGKNEVLKGSFSGIVVATDGAHVNLGQATIDCSSAPWPAVGIHLPSGRSGVHVNGGIVQNCNIGVLLGDPMVWGGPAGSRNHVNGVSVRSTGVTGGTHFDGDGIAINNGVNNRLNGNAVEGFHPVGIRVFKGSNNEVAGNTVQTQTRPGDPYDTALLLQEAVGTSVRDNNISHNGNRGIWAPFNASQNVLTGNTAVGNGGVDVQDDTSPCANRWRDNEFDSVSEASAGCIK